MRACRPGSPLRTAKRLQRFGLVEVRLDERVEPCQPYRTAYVRAGFQQLERSTPGDGMRVTLHQHANSSAVDARHRAEVDQDLGFLLVDHDVAEFLEFDGLPHQRALRREPKHRYVAHS